MKVYRLRNGLAALLLTAVLALLPLSADASTQQPKFSLSAVGQSGNIALSDYRGQVVLINFWATWCPPCRQEIPSLIKLQEEFGPKEFTVIGLSMDEGGKRTVAKFAKKVGINYPLAMADGKVAQEFGGVIGIPVTFLIGRDGNIVKRYPGFVAHEVLERDITALVNGKK